jgi:hypothetical protein
VTISIPIVATLDSHKQAELDALVGEFVPLVFPTGQTHLRQIEVVPSASIPARSNARQATSIHPQVVYVPPAGRIPPVAIAVETGMGLDCYVLMPLEMMVNHPVRSSSNAPLLLEEMLHTDLYGQFWNQHGYWQPSVAQGPVHLVNLTVVATRLIDEYITNRRKAELIGTLALVEFDGTRKPGITMTPPGHLVQELHQSRHQLATIVQRHMAGQPAISTFNQVVTWAQRSVFEPMAYDIGKRAWKYPVDGTINEASQVPFIANHVRHHWNNIVAQMERARTTNLQEFPQAAATIVDELRKFLTHVGVHLQNDGTFEIRTSFDRWS